MLDLLAIIVIAISLIIILVIIIRKFPALAILDVSSIPEEKEAKFKNQIRKQLFDRALGRHSAKVIRIWKNISKKINNFFFSVIEKLNKKKHAYQSQKRISFEKKEKKAKKLLDEIDQYIIEEQYDKAEDKAILIIEFDKHNQEAFERLANIYFLQKKYDQSREIYHYILKMLQEKEDELSQASLYFIMSDISQKNNDISQAKDDIYQALAIDGKNPRYLDKLVELNIEDKNKEEAIKAFTQLFEVNPENNKLSKYKEIIDKL